MAQALRMDLAFDFATVVCRRSVAVPAAATLEDLHRIIQAVGNWDDVQEYDFEVIGSAGLKRFEPAWQIDLSRQWGEKNDAAPTASAAVEDVAVGAISCVYHYSYNEEWALKVELTPIDWPDDAPLPALLSGEGDWPCEGVGGEAAFEHFLEVANDPTHPENADCLTWAAASGFERFGQDAISERLDAFEL
jgi:hypothetical protein